MNTLKGKRNRYMIVGLTSSSRSDNPLQLIRFDPNDLVDSFIAPQVETLSAQLHSSSSHPKENVAVILKVGYRKLPHLVVGHCAVRKFHVNIPWRIWLRIGGRNGLRRGFYMKEKTDDQTTLKRVKVQCISNMTLIFQL